MSAAQVEVSTEILIQKVKEHKELWDRYTEGYRRRIDKDQAWRSICEDVVPDFNNFNRNVQVKIMTQLTKKWFNVRDSYVKSLKAYRRNKTKTYRHSEMLSFLDSIYLRYGDPYTYDQGQDKTADDDTGDVEYDDKASDDEPECVNEMFFDIDDEVKPAKQLKTNSSRAVPGPSTQDPLSTIVSNLIEREDDEDRSFFNSIMPTVKRLSNDSKLQFRIEVMTLLRKYTSVKQERDPIDGNEVDI